MPAVSVIIPVYNAAKTLRHCVESILFGTYKNVEIILVDDCSQDGSWELCQALKKQYDKVLAIQNNRNCGVSHTRNKGLDAAGGEYVLFCDSDDWMADRCVQTLVEETEKHNDALVCCGYTKCFAASEEKVVFHAQDRGIVEKEALFSLLDQELIQYVWNKCFRMDIIRSARLRFDESQYMGEDFQFVLDYMNALKSWRIFICKESLYFYSQTNPNSLVSRWSKPENLEQAVNRIRQLGQIVGEPNLGEQKVHELKQSFVYLIARDRSRSRCEQIQDIEAVIGDGNARRHYRRQRWLHCKERIAALITGSKRTMKRLSKIIPLWIKCPIAVLISEIRLWPLPIVLAHMRRSIAQNGSCSEDSKLKIEQKVQKITYNWVRKHYSNMVEKTATKYTLGQPVENGTVWVFWWQGEENTPILVKRCIASIRKHAGKHPVQIVDRNNYKQFVSVPPHIEEKREKGIISLTHFSDYLRMALLAQHGGLWLDATIYVTKDLHPAFDGPLFSVRNPGMDKGNISEWNWSVFAIGGNCQNLLFCLMRNLLDTYWNDNNSLIDYFLFDYMIRLLYDNCESIRTVIDSIPANNPELYYYQSNFNKEANGNTPPSDTWLYKLSWKAQYMERTNDGEETVYGQWLRETEKTLCL